MKTCTYIIKEVSFIERYDELNNNKLINFYFASDLEVFNSFINLQIIQFVLFVKIDNIYIYIFE